MLQPGKEAKAERCGEVRARLHPRVSVLGAGPRPEVDARPGAWPMQALRMRQPPPLAACAVSPGG